MLWATSRAVYPPCSALVRSTFDVECRIVHRLLNANIGQARNLAKFVEHRGCLLRARHDIVALELNVDRRRQAEVQNLGGDVRGQKIKLRAGKLARQLSAQLRAHNRPWGDGPHSG